MTGSTAPLIAHVVYRLDFGGLENGLVNLVNRIPADRYRHAIVCLSGYREEFRRRIQRSDVDVISIGKRPGKDPSAYARVWRTLRRLKPDIVHTRNLGTVDLQWVAAAAGVRHRVHGEHGWEASDPEGRNPRNLAIRRACRPVIQRYVPMSRDLERWLVRDVGVRPARIRQLYNGVDTARFAPAERRQVPAGAPLTIGTVGRLDPVKNQAQLLHAFKGLLDQHDDSRRPVRLLLVGDGPLRGQLEKLAGELGIAALVEFAGARNDTPDLLRRMDVFVLPSMNEGISNTILEAMASGLPVVAGRVGGNPELVEHGVTGHLYDPHAPAGLQAALAAYVASDEQRLAHGSAGRQRALHSFRLEAMVQRYLDMYDELLGFRPASQPTPDFAGPASRRPGEGA